MLPWHGQAKPFPASWFTLQPRWVQTAEIAQKPSGVLKTKSRRSATKVTLPGGKSRGAADREAPRRLVEDVRHHGAREGAEEAEGAGHEPARPRHEHEPAA